MSTENRRIRGVHRIVQEAALILRREQTSEEADLWEALRDRKIMGVKFRRQYPVGAFVLDFYAPLPRLIIELDGAHHAEQQERDSERTACLNAHGGRVLRFSNVQVREAFSEVLNRIQEALKEA